MQYPSLVAKEYPNQLHLGCLYSVINGKGMQKQERRFQGDQQEGRRPGDTGITQVDERGKNYGREKNPWLV